MSYARQANVDLTIYPGICVPEIVLILLEAGVKSPFELSRFRQIEREAPLWHNLYLSGIDFYLLLFIPRHNRAGFQTIFSHCRG